MTVCPLSENVPLSFLCLLYHRQVTPDYQSIQNKQTLLLDPHYVGFIRCLRPSVLQTKERDDNTLEFF